MTKAEFEIPLDTVKVEPEISVDRPDFVPLHIFIPSDLKTEFQIWCVQHKMKMNTGIAVAIRGLIGGEG